MRATAPLGRMLAAQTRAELRLRWRVPAFGLTTLALPAVFFAFFGLPVARAAGPDGGHVGALLLASFGAFAVGSVMVYAFGVGVAVERGLKVDRLLRATPLPLAVLLAAKGLAALAFALLALGVLLGVGVLVGGVAEPPAVWAALVARLLAGSVPFAGLGFAIGYAAGPQAAPALANLIYLPLAFASGLFTPPGRLPRFLQVVAPYLPTYHYGQLAWGALGAASEPWGASVAWLAGYTVVFFALAAHAYRREQARKFG